MEGANPEAVNTSTSVDVSLSPPTVADLAGAVASLASMVAALVTLPVKERRGLKDDALTVAEVCNRWAELCAQPPSAPA